MPKDKLYIVEDEKMLRDVLFELLSEEYDVVAVHNPQLIEPEPGSIVLTDCEIPPYKPIFDFGPEVTVVRMSGNPRMNPDIAKPFGMDDIKSKLKVAHFLKTA